MRLAEVFGREFGRSALARFGKNTSRVFFRLSPVKLPEPKVRAQRGRSEQSERRSKFEARYFST